MESPDLISFWLNDMSVVEVSRCGLAHDTLLSEHALAPILRMLTNGLLKIISIWAVLTALLQPALCNDHCSMRCFLSDIWSPADYLVREAKLILLSGSSFRASRSVAPNGCRADPSAIWWLSS